jgi:sugar phosphate permease
MLFGLGFAFLLQISLVGAGVTANALGIALLGFLTFGPDTLVTGAGAMDLGTRRGAATVAGVINGVGSCGQLLSAHMVAYVSSLYGWSSLFYLFALFSFIGAALLATRWSYRAR